MEKPKTTTDRPTTSRHTSSNDNSETIKPQNTIKRISFQIQAQKIKQEKLNKIVYGKW